MNSRQSDSPQTDGVAELQTVERFLGTHFKIVDWQAVEIIFAVAAALYIPGEMVWLRLVGASRSGKTELLRAIAEHPDSTEIEYLSPAALRGGLREKKVKLLRQLNGRRVITMDMAALLTTRKDARSEVFGLLRSVKDGRLASDFGSMEGHLLQETHFDWLSATTPYFEQSRIMESLLGERFIDLWWIPADREEMAIQAAHNNPDLPILREILAKAVGKMLDEAKANANNIDASQVDLDWLGKVADIAALLRTPIVKDYNGNITSTPAPEIGTDLAQGFQRIALGLQLIGISDYQPYIARLARDCMPSVRRSVLSEIVREQATAQDIATRTTLPLSTVRYHLDDLRALGVVVAIGNTKTYKPKADLAEKIRSVWKQ